mgnify:CR=1 FL=1
MPKPIAVKDRRKDTNRLSRDRRDFVRAPFELWMEEITGEEVYFRRTGNISQGGAYFDNAIPHKIGTEIILKFTLPGDDKQVVAKGKVVSTTKNTNGLGMGVEFTSIEDDGRERINIFFNNLSS